MAVNADPHVLVVAGSDSSGGAGIARDVETLAAFGVRACLAVTAVTVQTHVAVDHVEMMPPRLIAEQMLAALTANHISAVKIGMLGSEDAIGAVAAVLKQYPNVPTVFDPVMAASSGRALLPDGAIGVMRNDLIPLCTLVTPNLIELAILTGDEQAQGELTARRQGTVLLDDACDAVLVKGGHGSNSRSVDILLRRGQVPIRFDAPRLLGTMRGTGCMLASAAAAWLALGAPIEESVRKAKQLVHRRLRDGHAP
ncbi:hydroxymethylpyrimidine/phosphomethylpyrimidine kinase [Pseudaminobacter arsenicus]|uniref:hydroxymethylpyrimidine kinase n=1 Tax=Borborobacter arsenicus TaxID=1851146 RepID=A0A432V2H9_9HYPH|nr:hydroxymethylpyrimidine/phosphomethylpyrimidine kinase [Pseudaminobacter arsenicus]RUM96308.1 hydroxymethylpyrimidine/phosphomethylpyrimidine kinase [Pseudaminobacter arsenicus]